MSSEINEWVEQTFSEKVEQHDGLTLDDVQGWYDDKEAEYDEEGMVQVSVMGEFNKFVNTQPDGEVELYTIGFNDDVYNNGEVFHGYGLIFPPEGQAGLGVIQFEEQDLDFRGEVEHYFMDPFTPVRGEFDIRSAEKVSGAYRLDAVAATELEEYEPEHDPTVDDRRERVDEHIEKAEIRNIGDQLSLLDGEYPADNGVDMRRIEYATVLETRVGKQQARYVVQDNSYLEARELPDDVRGDEEENGLVCWMDTDIADFGVDSIVDLYGYTSVRSDTAQISFQVVGVNVRDRKELQTSNGGESEQSASTDDSVGGAAESRTIGGD